MNSFTKVFNGKGERLRGLWERNGSFYAQLTLTDSATGLPTVKRLRLETNGTPVTSVSDAIKALHVLQAKRDSDIGLQTERKLTPTFADYAQSYLAHVTALNNKRPSTLASERLSIRRLTEYFGALRLRQIDKRSLNGYMAKRIADGVCPRTVNTEHIALRSVLRQAIADGLLNSLAIEGTQWLKYNAPRKPLLTSDEINRVADAAIAQAPIRGQTCADFIKLMCFSGGRASETLRLRWSDVDFDRSTLTIGSDGLAKNHKSRQVDFNPALKAHLQDMATRKQPDSLFLFPGGKAMVQSMDRVINKARIASGVTQFTAHLCRHYFASMTLMSGVDVQTVASWLGHSDGGALLLKTYAHLLNTHRQAQAQRVIFSPIALAS